MTISAFCRDQLLTSGPLPLPVLTARAVAAGKTAARDPANAVRSAIAYTAVLLPDDRWATPLWLLEGRILTTRRLSPRDEYGGDYRDPVELPDGASDDLALLDAALRCGALPLADGGLLRRSPYGSGWNAPDGWPGVQPGPDELLGFRVRAGTLDVELVVITDALRAAGAGLAAELGPLDRPGRYAWSGGSAVSEHLVTALWTRMAEDPTLLTEPVPPLSECIPPLADALAAERAQRRAAARRWHPPLDLDAGLLPIAAMGARRSDQLLPEWLSQFVTNALLDLDAEYDESGFDHGCGDPRCPCAAPPPAYPRRRSA